MTSVWDLNADLGEGDADMDTRLLEVVTSANVACGGHAGDPESMRRICSEAVARGVAIGAQVSYVDREGFGRHRIDVSAALLSEQIAQQIAELDVHARAAGTEVSYVKPHGALYHVAASDHGTSEAVLTGAGGLPILTLPHGALRASAIARGIPAHAEAFADRGYLADGGLVPRGQPGALLVSPATVTDRVRRLVAERRIVAIDGTHITVDARSICVHADTPGADAIARLVREVLVAGGATVRSFAPLRGSG